MLLPNNFLLANLIDRSTGCTYPGMKLHSSLFVLWAVFALNDGMAHASESHSVKGVVISADGTSVSEFALTVKETGNGPALIRRLHFKHGEFFVDGLQSGRYELQIVSPLYIPLRMDLIIKPGTKGTGYRVAVLHSFRNEPQFMPANPASAKRLQQKVPRTARDAYSRAVQFHREGELDKALIEYGAAIRLYPTYIDALTDLGAILVLLDRPEAGLAFLRRAHNVDDTDSVININIAAAMTEQADYAGAMKMLHKVLKDDPHVSLAQYYVAKIQCIQEHYAEAARSAEEAVAANPDLLEAWILLMEVNEQLKNPAGVRDALAHLRDAINDKIITRFFDEQLRALDEGHT